MAQQDLEKGDADEIPRWNGLSTYLRQDVCKRHSDLVLLLCSFISGLCDSGAFNAWSCFVSMQTGNTIFLGLGSAGLPATKPFGWLRSIVAIAAFVVGCFLFSLMRNNLPRSRAMLALSFLIQTACLTIAAVLVQTRAVPDAADNTHSMRVLAPIVFLGLQGGGQVWTSEVLGFKEIPTTVLTSIYFGLAADVNLTRGLRDNPARNRRIVAVVALLTGAISGGWLSKSRAGIPGIFFIAAGLKLAISVTWLFWRADST